VAGKLGVGTPQTLLNWVRRGQIDSGKRPGVSSDAAEELRRLRAENRELNLGLSRRSGFLTVS
jgi:transposase